jgi:hypothetical protein
MMHSKKAIGRRFGLLAALVTALLMACTGVVLAQGSSTANAGYANSSLTPSDAGQVGADPLSDVSSVTDDISAAASVPNGDFETGDFSGWKRANQSGGSGSWFVYSGTTSPLNGIPIAAPPQGNFAATTDQPGPGSHVLYRNIKLRSGRTHKLSFYLYYRNFAPGFSTPRTLNYTIIFNQQYRVDVLKPTGSPFTVSDNGILKPLFQTEVGDPNTLAPTLLTFNLTPFAGQTVRLRFAEVDNQDNFLASVDRVRVTSTPR